MHKSSRFRRIAFAVVLITAVIATAASGEEEASTNADGVSKGLGTTDASADVSAPTIVREGEGDFVIAYGQVAVTNNSSKRSDYFVTVVAESPDGSVRHDETMVSVMGLEPNQTSTEKGIFTKDIPADAVLKVQEVQRTAST
jgi:hypothetical protein